jgi:8-oxo-dGTP diphosphatase
LTPVCIKARMIPSMMRDLLIRMWMRLRGNLQWQVLWLFNSKFMLSVAGVVFNEDGDLLLLRHRYWVPDVWGLPGGIVESGERLEDALAREIREETGYTTGEKHLLQVASGYRYRVEAYYQTVLTGGTLRLQEEEILEARFFSADELPENLLPLQRNAICQALEDRVSAGYKVKLDVR